MEFIVGQKLNHPDHGVGTVTFVGDDYVGIEFAEGNEALLRREALMGELSADVAERPEAALAEEASEWPASTFVTEPAEARHFMGSHWEPFFADLKETWKRLPSIIEESRPLDGYGSRHKKSTLRSPVDWRKGVSLVWPNESQGIVTVIGIGAESHEIVSIFPFFAEGSRSTIRLKQVIVWENDLEGQITAQWGEAEVSFFDSHFVVNREWYEVGWNYEFVFIGIAYSVDIATVDEIPYTPNPDQVAWQRMLAEKRGEAPPEVPAKISLSGMSMFLPIEEWDVDDYQFRGPIKHVEPFGDMLGQDGWCMTVPVMRFGEEDADLRILVTRRAWRCDTPPAVGQDIEGQLWLQGRLWSIPGSLPGSETVSA